MIRQIVPIPWGPKQIATSIQYYSINDNADPRPSQGSCTLYWEVLSATGEPVAKNNASISGIDYDNWGGDNETIAQKCATSAGVTLLPLPEVEPVSSSPDFAASTEDPAPSSNSPESEPALIESVPAQIVDPEQSTVVEGSEIPEVIILDNTQSPPSP